MPLGFNANNTVTFSRLNVVSDTAAAPESPSSVVQNADEQDLADLDCCIIPLSASARMQYQRDDQEVTHSILLEDDVGAVKHGDVAEDARGATYTIRWVEDVGGMGQMWRVWVNALG